MNESADVEELFPNLFYIKRQRKMLRSKNCMSYFLIPVTNLIIEQNLIFKDTIIIPIYQIKQVEECKKTYPEIYSIITTNQSFYKHSCEHLLNICFVKTNNQQPCETDFEFAINIVNRALDYIRFSFCRIDLRDTLPGIPGIVDNTRYSFFYNHDNNTLSKFSLSPYFYSLQPGMGLELDYLINYENEDIYKILNSSRTDEVYKEYRSILSRAYFSFHITDLNRCFCYLFSTVERMGGQKYMRFQERKKRIISYISNSQHQYDVLNHQFYFYSKEVRTEIIHKGRNLSDMIPLHKITSLLQNLLLLIHDFCIAVISSDITSMTELETALNEKITLFEYKAPSDEIESVTNTNLGFLDSKKHVFFAEMPNLDIEFTLKQGNIIYLPINSFNNFNNYYWNYVYLDLIEDTLSTQDEYPVIKWNNTKLELDEQFVTFTAYDLNIILNTIKLHEVQEINARSAIAIILDEPFFKDTTWSFKSYSAFADIICDKINHGLDYIILSTDISQRNFLPSLAGINNGIRFAFMLDDIENIVHPIPGNVFAQYCCSPNSFIIKKEFHIDNVLLFNALFNTRHDEIAMLCKNALKRVVDCYYISDYTIQITYMFDILDMLDPNDTEGKYLKSHVLPFVAVNKTDYHQKCENFKIIRITYRNPLIHYGKSIYDLTTSQAEIYDIFNLLKEIIISYCETVISLNVSSFDSLNIELENTKRNLGIK